MMPKAPRMSVVLTEPRDTSYAYFACPFRSIPNCTQSARPGMRCMRVVRARSRLLEQGPPRGLSTGCRRRYEQIASTPPIESELTESTHAEGTSGPAVRRPAWQWARRRTCHYLVRACSRSAGMARARVGGTQTYWLGRYAVVHYFGWPRVHAVPALQAALLGYGNSLQPSVVLEEFDVACPGVEQHAGI